MSKKSSFRHYNLNQAKRHQLDVTRFGGVDYSTQKFLIADGRAIDLKNFVYKNGVVQKRHGIEEILEIETFQYIPASFDVPTQASEQTIKSNAENKRINGIWRFEAEDNQEHIVAHIGHLFYEIKDIGTFNFKAVPFTNGQASVNGERHYLAYEFEDFKSFAFVGGKKLWFLGGNKYMCLRFLNNGSKQFFAVEDSEHTPIPTTTISITYKNSIVDKRTGLDSANLLTEWRKNKLISGTSKLEDEKVGTAFYEYTLDAPIVAKKNEDINKIVVLIEEQGEIDYGI